jgi:hypothetical protein
MALAALLAWLLIDSAKPAHEAPALAEPEAAMA